MLLCKADGAVSLLSVEWWHLPQGQAQPELVASMQQDGTVQLGASYKQLNNRGPRRLEKMDWATFQLEISPTSITDSGVYECRVSEDTQSHSGGRSWTQKLAVTVKSLGKCRRNPVLNLNISAVPSLTVGCSGICASSRNPSLWHVHPRTQSIVSGCLVCPPVSKVYSSL